VLTKAGAGTLLLSATNTYARPTVVGEGTLLVNGSLAAGSSVTVAAGGTLGGTGVIHGAAAIQPGGTLAPGSDAVGTLTLGGGLTLAGVCLLEIGRFGTTLSQDLARVSGALNYGGILTVTNVGSSPFTAGDSFQLFSAGSYSGNFAATNLPALPSGLGWNWSPANGTLAVTTTVSTTPTSLTYAVGNGNASLHLSWPADHTGWRLQSQTNHLNQGLGGDWSDVNGSTVTNQMTLTIDAASPAVFYRLVYP
jgi:autotransporter-associated beta strand protein